MPPASPIALYYFAFFAALGVFWPFFSLYLAAAGLSPTQITRVLAISPVMSLVAPPLIGLIADAKGARAWLLRSSSVATAVAFQGFVVARGSRPALYATAAAFALCRAPVGSLVDATALDCVRRHGGSYGALRLWGSLGFLIAVVAGGVLLESVGLDFVLVSTGLALGLAAVCAFAMPAPPAAPSRPPTLALLEMALDEQTWLLLVAVMLAQIANGTYDACFSLHLQRAGFGSRFIGIAYAVGVGAEIALLAVSGAVLRRVGAARLLACSLATATVRWLVLARVTSGSAILCLQPLHGITFGFYYAAAVTLVRERGGPSAPTAAQGLFAAVTALGSVLGIAVSGPVLERAGGEVFLVGAGAAALATLAAFRLSRVKMRSSRY